MKILVCIKQVPGSSNVEVDPITGLLKRDGIQSKMNPYDLYAIETALNLTEKFGGNSVESTAGSTGEESSTETTSDSEQDSQDGGDETPDGEVTEGEWNEAVKDEKFNNVTFAYSVVFEGTTKSETGKFYLDGDKGMYQEGASILEAMDAEELAALRNIYVNTTLAVVNNFSSFTYDAVKGVFVSKEPIVYRVNVIEYDATITASNVEVKLDSNKNISEITCDMKHEYTENGRDYELTMKATFTFTDYGTTVVNVPANP